MWSPSNQPNQNPTASSRPKILSMVSCPSASNPEANAPASAQRLDGLEHGGESIPSTNYLNDVVPRRTQSRAWGMQPRTQLWLTKGLATLFGADGITPATEIQPERHTDSLDDEALSIDPSILTSTTLTVGQSTLKGTLSSTVNTSGHEPVTMHPAEQPPRCHTDLEHQLTRSSLGTVQGSHLPACRSSQASPHGSSLSVDGDRSAEWFYTVGRSANIGSLSSSFSADPAFFAFPSPHVSLGHAPTVQAFAKVLPPPIVVDTCAFIARFGTAHVYTEPSDDDFLSVYSPKVTTWAEMYDATTGERVDLARDPVSWKVARFGRHRKVVSWSAMEALRYWLLARSMPVVPLVTFQSGYRTLLAAPPGRVAESLIAHLETVLDGQYDPAAWAIFKHVVRHARKEAGKYPAVVEWMAKDWGSALGQVEDRGQWKSERDMGVWMESVLTPVMVVLLTSKVTL